ncbi:hypothetical protein C1646_814152 [Rhizophagus diaphanus]|nr:hypothetical protein C1646_814152 [Rhizophagus diaphanus] [Rhizophagus sp. MUCL 43196]
MFGNHRDTLLNVRRSRAKEAIDGQDQERRRMRPVEEAKKEIYVPKLLKYGVLHEAFVFMLTSFAGESFASKRNTVTKEEKRLAIEGLQEIHALGVKHGDIRLDNIMVSRLTGRSRVWWIDFALSEIIGNAEDLKAELLELRYLLDLW